MVFTMTLKPNERRAAWMAATIKWVLLQYGTTLQYATSSGLNLSQAQVQWGIKARAMEVTEPMARAPHRHDALPNYVCAWRFSIGTVSWILNSCC